MAEPIIISGETLLAGMSDSKFNGIQEIRNLDLFSQKGVIKIAYKSTAESGGSVPTSGFVTHGAVNPANGDTYYADDTTTTGIYKRTSAGTWSTITGGTSTQARGLVVFQDYLFRVFNSGGDTKVDRYGPLSGSPSWSNNWATIQDETTSSVVPTIVGQDDIVYFGIGKFVASISDPDSAPSANVSALDLPDGYTIQSFTELGQNLLIGATQGNSVSSVGDIFPWDRTSSSFSIPISTGFAGVPLMYTKNNLVYSLCGKYGTLILTNGSTVEQGQRLAGFTDEPEVAFRDANYGAIDAWNGGILVGLGKSAGTSNGPVGVWFLREGAWQYYPVSAGDGADADGIDIGVIFALSDYKYLVTWADLTGANTYGVDIVDTSRRVSSYGAYAKTKFYNVGTTLSPRTFQSLEFQLTKPLASDQGIKVSYRLDPSASFVEIDTFAYGDASGSSNDNLGAITSFNFSPLNIPPCQMVQFQVSLTTGTSNDATPELLYVSIN